MVPRTYVKKQTISNTKSAMAINALFAKNKAKNCWSKRRDIFPVVSNLTKSEHFLDDSVHVHRADNTFDRLLNGNCNNSVHIVTKVVSNDSNSLSCSTILLDSNLVNNIMNRTSVKLGSFSRSLSTSNNMCLTKSLEEIQSLGEKVRNFVTYRSRPDYKKSGGIVKAKHAIQVNKSGPTCRIYASPNKSKSSDSRNPGTRASKRLIEQQFKGFTHSVVHTAETVGNISMDTIDSVRKAHQVQELIETPNMSGLEQSRPSLSIHTQSKHEDLLSNISTSCLEISAQANNSIFGNSKVTSTPLNKPSKEIVQIEYSPVKTRSARKRLGTNLDPPKLLSTNSEPSKVTKRKKRRTLEKSIKENLSLIKDISRIWTRQQQRVLETSKIDEAVNISENKSKSDIFEEYNNIPFRLTRSRVKKWAESSSNMENCTMDNSSIIRPKRKRVLKLESDTNNSMSYVEQQSTSIINSNIDVSNINNLSKYANKSEPNLVSNNFDIPKIKDNVNFDSVITINDSTANFTVSIKKELADNANVPTDSISNDNGCIFKDLSASIRQNSLSNLKITEISDVISLGKLNSNQITNNDSLYYVKSLLQDSLNTSKSKAHLDMSVDALSVTSKTTNGISQSKTNNDAISNGGIMSVSEKSDGDVRMSMSCHTDNSHCQMSNDVAQQNIFYINNIKQEHDFAVPAIPMSRRAYLPGKKYRRSVLAHRGTENIVELPKNTVIQNVLHRDVRRSSIRIVPIKLNISETEEQRNDDTNGSVGVFGHDSVESLHNSYNSSLQKSASVEEKREVAPETARDIVLSNCCQTRAEPWEKFYPDGVLKNCRKIGEGVYGEVFMFRNAQGTVSVMKVIPIEGDKVVNGEPQKKFQDVISEIIIAKKLSDLPNTGFNRLESVHLVHGAYPERLLDLWRLYDDSQRSENDCPDSYQTDSQLYLVLQLQHGGKDLESYEFNNAAETYSIFVQLSHSLAQAERHYSFEHRDLHWGNILVSACPPDTTLTYSHPNASTLAPNDQCNTITFDPAGVLCNVIDYTLSRMTVSKLEGRGLGRRLSENEEERFVLYNDLSLDPELFNGENDVQFDVYRQMRDETGNDWSQFRPKTNLYWLNYVLQKMLTDISYSKPRTKMHKTYMAKLRRCRSRINQFSNTQELATSLIE